MYAPCITSHLTMTRTKDGGFTSSIIKDIDRFTYPVIDEVVADVTKMLSCNILRLGGVGTIRFVYDPRLGMAFDIRQYQIDELNFVRTARMIKNITRLEELQWLTDGTTGRPLQFRVAMTFCIH
jgi:hypothetical protein